MRGPAPRLVITGLGTVTAAGVGTNALAAALAGGQRIMQTQLLNVRRAAHADPHVAAKNRPGLEPRVLG